MPVTTSALLCQRCLSARHATWVSGNPEVTDNKENFFFCVLVTSRHVLIVQSPNLEIQGCGKVRNVNKRYVYILDFPYIFVKYDMLTGYQILFCLEEVKESRNTNQKNRKKLKRS